MFPPTAQFLMNYHMADSCHPRPLHLWWARCTPCAWNLLTCNGSLTSKPSSRRWVETWTNAENLRELPPMFKQNMCFLLGEENYVKSSSSPPCKSNFWCRLTNDLQAILRVSIASSLKLNGAQICEGKTLAPRSRPEKPCSEEQQSFMLRIVYAQKK